MSKRPQGFSLIESAVALAIMGVLVAGFLFFSVAAKRETLQLGERDLLVRADAALLAYASTNYRLPCPAAAPGGGESCAANLQKGYLPAGLLGLPDEQAKTIRYGVYRAPDAVNPRLDVDLAVAKDRYYPLTTAGAPPVGAEISIAHTNAVDLCFAINSMRSTASVAAANAAGLQVLDPGGASRNVAYALAMPGLLDGDGDGNLFDGQQVAAGFVFDAPQRPVSLTYDDQVRVAGFDSLFGELACGDALSSAGHAHFNSAAGAAMMAHAMTDYQVQLNLAVELAQADVAAAVAGNLGAIAGVAGAASALALAIAEAILSYGATSGFIALGAVAIAANAIGLVLSIAATAAAAIALTEAQNRASELEGTYHLVSNSATLASQIDSNARAADAAGLR